MNARHMYTWNGSKIGKEMNGRTYGLRITMPNASAMLAAHDAPTIEYLHLHQAKPK